MTDSLRTHAERRLLFALGRLGRLAETARVLLDDVNGPRGGVDKRCRIAVHIAGRGDVRVQQLDSDLYAAIDRAAGRARRALAREKGRRTRYPSLVPSARL